MSRTPRRQSRGTAPGRPGVRAAEVARGAREVREALARGDRNARELMLAQRKARARGGGPGRRGMAAARAGAAGLVVAEGDSWFQYPFCNVLSRLEDDFGWDVESVAHAGDTIESMAYDPLQLDAYVRKLEKLARDGRTPKAVLLSAGGNDIAGPALWTLLNHRHGPAPGLSDSIMAGVFDERLRAAYVALIGAMTAHFERLFHRKPPLVVHGYDYPVPDGRGYAGGFWLLPGPWLRPNFKGRGYDEDALRDNTRHMAVLIDRFNAMVRGVAAEAALAHVRYVDCRGALSTALPRGYRDSWANELHPTERGFAEVASRFDGALRRV